MSLGRFVVQLRRQPRDALRDLGESSIRIGLIAATALLTLVVFGRPFLQRALSVDYNALYADYMQQPLVALQWYTTTYGWMVCFLAGLGFIIGMWSGIMKADAAAFIGIYGALSLLAWLLVARQTGEQYTLNFTPMVVLGLTAFIWTVALRSSTRVCVLALCIGTLYMGANVVGGLTRIDLMSDSPVRPLFALNEAPFTRSDYGEVVRLVDYLRTVVTDGEPIYVAASSDILGKDTVVAAERDVYGWDKARLNVLPAPAVNSRDFLPLELLLQAQYVPGCGAVPISPECRSTTCRQSRPRSL